ncbi:glycoside hydrolase family 3 C-terminal domain-containing protein [Ruficoccus amylovorans]|uniref:Glycoside hydrolase family 3 C-terminal domain-containing protein n=1 Tax=Ruficoccus amylovorans TaxID=1804625 RepID=A0A842HKX5_9BACT|nr:glycoside hydrolase family 3 C-terminal domain-containing protein [Ruficoccus amylovorans]MBC2596117.1 glycoside hydrolase family 3 C-terminal domain-containing protein [Ruficoccus amylovorans]
MITTIPSSLNKHVKPCVVIAAMAFVASLGLVSGKTPVYKDPDAPLNDRVDDLFDRLTEDEKLSLMAGSSFGSTPIPRLGVPSMTMVDAGQGVRGGAKETRGPATAFPSGVTMASSWDAELLRRIGETLAVETLNKGPGSQILLGPAINIHRSPLGGRNGEYFSEDPYLTALMAVPYIRGLQSNGVAACAKHFAANNEETDRSFVDVQVSERALREIYLPAFRASVQEAGAWTVMSSYNKVNGVQASENSYLLTDVLRKGWGFDGVVISDWHAVHDVASVQAGNNLEMPDGKYATPAEIKTALRNGIVTQEAIDASAKSMLRTIIRVGLLDHVHEPDNSRINAPEHSQLAQEVAEKSIVLLKNERGVLPIGRKKVRSIAVIGQPAKDLMIGAEGSPRVEPFKTVQILDGIEQEAGNSIKVHYYPFRQPTLLAGNYVRVPGTDDSGFRAEYFENMNYQGEPVLTRVEPEIDFEGITAQKMGIPLKRYSVRWTTDLSVPVSGVYYFGFMADDGFQLKIDGKTVLERQRNWASRERLMFVDIPLQSGEVYKLELEYLYKRNKMLARLEWMPPAPAGATEAVTGAREADIAIVCASTLKTEGEAIDRSTMNLPMGQTEQIRAIAAANQNTVVVLNNGGPVDMSEWVDAVPAVLEAWLPGENGGAAIARILFGEVNPSGKLPVTLALKRSDYPDYGNFPGTGDYSKNESVAKYEEGIYVGYRHFDKAGIEPLFPFGHGLSYTTFDIGEIALSQASLKADGTVEVHIQVANTGNRAGEEVVQLYVHDPKPRVDKPVRQLKGFRKVALKPGEMKTVVLMLSPRDLAYFDADGKQWRADAGSYEIQVGTSSRSIRRIVTLELEESWTEAVPLSRNFTNM